MTEQFPKIPDTPQSVALDTMMTRISLERPDLLRLWQESVRDLVGELAVILKKRNDTPDQITERDTQRAHQINEEMRDRLERICMDSIRDN